MLHDSHPEVGGERFNEHLPLFEMVTGRFDLPSHRGLPEKNTRQAEACIFLNEQKLCRIYDHLLRPADCRLYPFSYGGADADCVAYLEHARVVKILLMNERSFEIYDASFCPNPDVRLIPYSKWPEIRRTLRLSNVPREMIRALLILKDAPLMSVITFFLLNR